MDNKKRGTKAIAPKKPKPSSSMERSRKGCMRGKGGPDNAHCTYRGVRQCTWGKWVAEICNLGTRLWLGTFNMSAEAAVTYDDTARKLYGPSAKLQPFETGPPYQYQRSQQSPWLGRGHDNFWCN